MGKVAVSFRIMPEGVEVDIDRLQAAVRTSLGGRLKRLEVTPVAFGLNARSRVLTDWPGGGFIGIHGTNAPELVPGRISHGCIRMRNDAILRLATLMPLGTPVTIR